MELYTLVSLIIGIFGATYAVQSALRTNFDWQMKDAKERSDDMLKALIAVETEVNLGVAHCKGYRNTIHRSYVWWCWAHTIPAILFFISIAAVTIWVLCDWDDVVAQHSPTALATMMTQLPWSYLHAYLALMATSNFLCALIAGGVFWNCKTADGHLQKHHDHLKPNPAGSNGNGSSQQVTVVTPVTNPTITT